MAITRNFRITGVPHALGEFTAELNGTTVFSGVCSDLPWFEDNRILATGSFTYDLGVSPLIQNHTVVPCVITVQSGTLDIGLWQWENNSDWNPALPAECQAYIQQWALLPDDTPFAPSAEVQQAAKAAGGWAVVIPSEWWTGGLKHAAITRFNMLLNGTPITTFDDENWQGSWNVLGLQSGDVLSYDLAIPNVDVPTGI